MSRPRTSLSYPRFLSEVPLGLWVGPEAARTLLPRLVGLLDRGVQPVMVPGESTDSQPPGPAVLLLCVEDVQGPARARLLDIATAALPARPVIVGGSNDRDVLFDAINSWRAFRLLARDGAPELIADAVRKAHEAYALEVGVQLGVDNLQQECDHLDRALDQLRQAQERLLHTERLGMVGRICRSLQARLRVFFEEIEALKDSCQDDDDEDSLDSLLEATVDASLATKALLDDMVGLTEGGEKQLELVPEDLDAVVERASLVFHRHPELKLRDFRVSCCSGVSVRVDRHRLFHALMNLVRNAIQATDEGGRVELRTTRSGAQAVIEVEDGGIGMTEEVRAKIFDPFFTTKGSEGMGLGLRMTKSAIERQAGSLECASTPGQGTCFRILLPVVADLRGDAEKTQ